MMRRIILAACCAIVAALALPRAANAQSDTYPSRNIRLFIPFAAAGVMDIVGRIVFEKVGASLRQTVVVENRPGAGGTIAMGELARSAPDGYTIAIADPAGSLAAGVSLYPKLPYDPRISFVPVGQVGMSGAVLSVSPALPVKTIQEFVALAKARRGELTYGSAGNGSPGHLNGELFKRLVGIEAGGRSLVEGEHAARFSGGKVGVLQGCKTWILQNQDGQINSTHSVSAGLDYAAVGQIGRAHV